LVKREQSAVGFDPDNKRFMERHTATTGESMADFLNKRIAEYREIHPEVATDEKGIPLSTPEALKARKDADEHSIRLFLRENDHLLYMGKVQRRTGKNDLLKIKDELFFSKYKVTTTSEIIKPLLRDEMEKFDVAAYEKKKNITRRMK
jgi:hypothetical protein